MSATCSTASAISVPVHRDHRGRGRDRRRRRPGDHPPRPVEVPRRAEPALGTDRLRHRGRHPALALHRRRPRRDARAAVRRRAAERPRPVHIHRQARGAPDGGGPGPADRWPALVRGDDADARLRAQQPPAVQPGRTSCLRRAKRPSCACPVARSCGRPRGAGVARDRDRRELAPREVDLLVVGGGPAGLGAAVYGASEGLDTLVIEYGARRAGGLLAQDRELPRLPRRHHRDRARQPRCHPGAHSERGRRRPTGRSRSSPARTPRRALEEDHEIAARAVVLATGANTGAYRSTASRLRGAQHLLRRGASGGAAAPRVRASWAAATRPARPRSGSRAVALVTLLHRRADLRETMSDYLVRDLERYGVAVRDRSEIAALHGSTGTSKPSPSRAASACRSPSCSSSSAPAVHRLAGRHRGA